MPAPTRSEVDLSPSADPRTLASSGTHHSRSHSCTLVRFRPVPALDCRWGGRDAGHRPCEALLLSIGKLVAGQERYYEQQVARGRDDYYAGEGEAPGRWMGAGAATLGLDGEVDAEAFGALIAGRDPKSGEVLRSASARDRVCSLDLTFSAPKSVSVLFAIGDAETPGRWSKRMRRQWRPRSA